MSDVTLTLSEENFQTLLDALIVANEVLNFELNSHAWASDSDKDPMREQLDRNRQLIEQLIEAAHHTGMRINNEST